ncbi:MAG: class I SAM-dependent methyltransferase [Rubrivivax sp.]|nr:class I SAM-dependent methyltransferase [Rubrivivax sp.]MDH5340058.1 class I SAM-dependent methyltransferase [Rubrivivax sp.]
MTVPGSDKVFSGSVARLYESLLVPLIFEPYAADLAQRVAERPVRRVLEVAAGTGVVTRQLAARLPAAVEIVATDLNPPMLAMAAEIGTSRPVDWRAADAQHLPFDDGSFDAVVCQFGVMFFPDKARAFAEARRVLRGGGAFVFSVWDRIETSEFAHVVTQSLEALFPDDPPRFLARTPHGYHDVERVARDLALGGFTTRPRIETIAARSRAASARQPALAYCQGTPLRNEIEARDATRLAEATDHAERAVVAQFGPGAVDSGILAHVLSVER